MATSFNYEALHQALLEEPSRDKLIHTWINQQYKFAIDEAEADEAEDRQHIENVRTSMLQRDLQTLDEESEDEALPDDEFSPCYDSLFYKPTISGPQDANAEESERQVALHFLLHEMRDWYLDDDERRNSLSARAHSPTPSSTFSDTPPLSPSTPALGELGSDASTPTASGGLSPNASFSDDCPTPVAGMDYYTEMDRRHVMPSRASSISLPRPYDAPSIPSTRPGSESVPSSPKADHASPYFSSYSHARTESVRPSESRWSLSTSINEPSSPTAPSFNDDDSTGSRFLKPSRSMAFGGLGNLLRLPSRHSKKRTLLIQGLEADDEVGFDYAKRWCENLGEIARISRAPNGDIHVRFRKQAVADTVCRLNTQVLIKGVGSVSLSSFTGKRH